MTIHADADIHADVEVGVGTAVWAHACVREGAQIGHGCVLGRGVYVDVNVVVGDNCKIQDGARLYRPALLSDGVFVGPGAVLANDRHPRAVTPTGEQLGPDEWTAEPVVLGEGSSVGANATILPGVTVGSWAMIAAGSVATRDVDDFALMAGVPAIRRGWVGRSGVSLTRGGGDTWQCPTTGEVYVETHGRLRPQL